MKKTIIFLFALVFISSCTPQDAPNTFPDSRDGKVYKTVTIGEQVWLAENLAYLPSVIDPPTGSEDAGHETDPYYYVYGYADIDVAAAKATENYQTYGVLYNWTAAITACPSGWHLPSDAEWKQLEMYLGVTQEEADETWWRGTDEGGKLKEVGTFHWESPNEGATNESGFTALPGGFRVSSGALHSIGSHGYWWSSTEYNADSAWIRGLTNSLSNVDRDFDGKVHGFSVRCVRD